MNIRPVYDLDVTPYIVPVNNYKFAFSSETYKNKFLAKLQDICYNTNHSLSTRWGFVVVLNDLGVLLAYLKTEHRGCRIILSDGSEIRQWEEIKYKDGHIMKNS